MIFVLKNKNTMKKESNPRLIQIAVIGVMFIAGGVYGLLVKGVAEANGESRPTR